MERLCGLEEKKILNYSFYLPCITCLIAKFRLRLKKIGKPTRPFRYNLNQILYDYTVEVRNRFKGLDLTECLMNYGRRFITLYRRQGSRPSPKKEMKNSKMAV